MFSAARMKALAARRQELLERNAVQRQLLVVEWKRVEGRIIRIDQGISAARRVLPVVALLLPLIKVWRSRGAGSMVDRLIRLLPLAPRFISIWQKFHRQ